MKTQPINWLSVLFLLCVSFSSWAQTIVKAEYFIDTDPGIGNGKELPLSAGGQVDEVTEVTTEGLGIGFHTLYIRLMDNAGIWSMTEGRPFFIDKSLESPATIVAAEYFIDESNPVPGNGTSIAIEPGSTVDFETQIDISGLALGEHRLNLRLQDNKGAWSYTRTKEFTIANPRIDAITPVSGGNIGDVTINILGASFDEGTTIKLTRNGQPDIVVPDSLMSLFNGELIQALLDLRGKEIGEYDVVATLGDGSSLTVPNGFVVVEGIKAHPWAEVLGFDRIRFGQWQTYTLVYGNKGNVDAHGVPLWFAVSDEAEIKIDFEFEKPYESFNVPYHNLYDSIPDFFVADTVMEYIGKKKVVGIYLPSIPANSSNTLTFQVKVTSSDPIEILAWAGEPLFGSPLRGWASECMNDLFDLALGTNPVSNCLNNAFNMGYELGNVISKAWERDSWGHLAAGVFLKMPAVIVSNTYDCLASPLKAITVGDKMIKMMIKISAARTTGSSGIPLPGGLNADIIENCLPPPEPPKPPKPVTPVASFDPNDKLGLEGAGSKKFITGSEVFPYLIRFENKATATAAAQTVLIVDTLDITKFDLSSFELGYFNFADRYLQVPPGHKNYTGYVDLRPEQELIVKIEAKLDEKTGVLTWLYTSLDPATRKQTENPDAGFLPPNKTAPEGDGGVFYTIRPKMDLITNEDIKNKAYIYFDNNEVIPTPTWSNSIDKVPPVSQVFSLDEVQRNSTFTVSWDGNDEGAGISNYSIYVSENNKPFTLWLYKVTETSSIFEGKADSIYQFYSVAQDSTGILEAVPDMADAFTTVSIITGIEEELEKQIIVYPNPATHTITVDLPGNFLKSKLSIIDMQGAIIMNVEGANEKTIIPINPLAKGMYLLRISNKEMVVNKKILIQ